MHFESSKDTLGDKLKAQEQIEAGRTAARDLPIIARLDGRSFHTFTKGLQRPYDMRMTALMQDTMRFLVDETHAIVGYCQSDEITLCWNNGSADQYALTGSEYPFGGKFQKLTSVLAGMASSYFSRRVPELLPEKQHLYPHFDCRVWNVPDMHHVYLNYLWRQEDCIKNSITMAAQACFSHKQLQGVGSEQKKQMLREAGHPWEYEIMPFRFGTFAKRRTVETELSADQLVKIPKAHRPTGKVMRSMVFLECYDHLPKVENIQALLFDK